MVYCGRTEMFRNRNSRSKTKGPRPPEEPDTSSAIGFTDAANAATQVYLVKMPNFLMEKFSKPVAPGETPPVVGRLRIPNEDSYNYNPNRELPEGEAPPPKANCPRIFIDTHGHPPESFEMHFQEKAPKIYVFSETGSAEDPALRVEGQVSYICTTQPTLDRRYRSINRERTRRAETKTRGTLFMDDSERRRADNKALKPDAMVETARQREERKKIKENARKHLDVPNEQWRELAKVAVFKAFEGTAHYAAEQLAKDVDEPLARLRSIINEVCTYNKSGPFSGKYELKDEFKTVKQRMQKEREVEEYRAMQIENAKRRAEERAERERQEGRPNKRSKMG